MQEELRDIVRDAVHALNLQYILPERLIGLVMSGDFDEEKLYALHNVGSAAGEAAFDIAFALAEIAGIKVELDDRTDLFAIV